MQVAQRVCIDDFIFIVNVEPLAHLVTSGDAGFTAVRIELHGNLVSNEHFDAVQPHLSCEVCQYYFPVLQRHSEQRVGQGLFNDTLYFLCWRIHQLTTKTILTYAETAVNNMKALWSHKSANT